MNPIMAGTMIPLNTLTLKSLFSLLYQIDLELLENTRNRGCPFCGGPLHNAHFQRKPRGGPPDLQEAFEIRFSLCCGSKGCRRRTMPPSVRFWGRRVYWAPVLLLITALRQNRNPDVTLNHLKSFCGVWRSTVNRWKEYFLSIFPQSEACRRLSGHLKPQSHNGCFPYDLLKRLSESVAHPKEVLIRCLKLLILGP